MKISTSASSPTAVAADLMAVAVTLPVKLEGAAAALDDAIGGQLTELAAAGEIRGNRGRVVVVHTAGRGVKAKRVAVVGMGAAAKVDAEAIRNAAATACRSMQSVRGTRLALVIDGLGVDAADAAGWAVEGAAIAGYRFDRYKTVGANDLPKPPRSLTLVTSDRAARRRAQRAGIVAAAVNRARDLQHTPPNELGPEELAERAREIAAGDSRLRCKVLDERGIARHRMGAFLAVAQGSGRPPRLIELHYRPAKARSGMTLGIVGKGLTYDSGGYSIKPVGSLATMKFDMSGGAAALEAAAAIAELGLPINVVTVVGSVENMIDRNAYRPDDIVTAANGKTIEITNTDAEGRLVLADCLHHARRLGATHLIDLATLTGGATIALGDYHAGLMSNDDEWSEQVRAAGDRSGDHLWPLPLHDTHKRMFRSDVADMANSSTMRMAIPCYAGRFLQEFAGDGPWAHVDMAGTADIPRPRDYYARGGTGYGVRLLVELAESLC
jgi:leucyl aminopeptidase